MGALGWQARCATHQMAPLHLIGCSRQSHGLPTLSVLCELWPLAPERPMGAHRSGMRPAAGDQVELVSGRQTEASWTSPRKQGLNSTHRRNIRRRTRCSLVPARDWNATGRRRFLSRHSYATTTIDRSAAGVAFQSLGEKCRLRVAALRGPRSGMRPLPVRRETCCPQTGAQHHRPAPVSILASAGSRGSLLCASAPAASVALGRATWSPPRRFTQANQPA